MPKSIGQFLAVLRKAKGYTQQQIADELGVSNKTISSWECDMSSPDISFIPLLADLYGVTCDEILRGERRAAEKEAEGDGTKKSEKAVSSYLNRYRSQAESCAAVALVLTGAGFLAFWLLFLLGGSVAAILAVPLVCYVLSALFFLMARRHFHVVLPREMWQGEALDGFFRFLYRATALLLALDIALCAFTAAMISPFLAARSSVSYSLFALLSLGLLCAFLAGGISLLAAFSLAPRAPYFAARGRAYFRKGGLILAGLFLVFCLPAAFFGVAGFQGADNRTIGLKHSETYSSLSAAKAVLAESPIPDVLFEYARKSEKDGAVTYTFYFIGEVPKEYFKGYRYRVEGGDTAIVTFPLLEEEALRLSVEIRNPALQNAKVSLSREEAGYTLVWQRRLLYRAPDFVFPLAVALSAAGCALSFVFAFLALMKKGKRRKA